MAPNADLLPGTLDIAKYYTLTAAGRRRLRQEAAAWKRLSTAIAAAMNTTADEV